MPEIPKEALAGVSNILKPAKLKLKVGDRQHFTITKPHQMGEAGLYSVPVKYGEGIEGNFPLNKTHTTLFVETLGSNSDSWVGAEYDAMVIPQNNPQSKQEVTSWTVLRDTIKAPTKGKHK